METIFKVGDKVFDALYGWGIVEIIYSENTYPVQVKYKDISPVRYTYDGRLGRNNKSANLSFTEYTFQGFTQTRPIPDIKPDTPIFVRHKPNQTWKLRYFSHWNNGIAVTAISQLKCAETAERLSWQFYSVGNPLK